MHGRDQRESVDYREQRGHRVVPILKMQQSRWPIGITRLLSTGFALLLPGPGGRKGGQEQIPAWPLLTVTCGPNGLTSLCVTGRGQHLPEGGTDDKLGQDQQAVVSIQIGGFPAYLYLGGSPISGLTLADLESQVARHEHTYRLCCVCSLT